jgi:hypothetical protein
LAAVVIGRRFVGIRWTIALRLVVVVKDVMITKGSGGGGNSDDIVETRRRRRGRAGVEG